VEITKKTISKSKKYLFLIISLFLFVSLFWFSETKGVNLNLQLSEGWNIISSPSESSLTLSQIEKYCTVGVYKEHKLWAYDSKNWEWSHPSQIKNDEGVYLYIFDNCNVGLEGDPAQFSSKPLYMGWNLFSTETSFNEIKGNCQIRSDPPLWEWDSQTKQWKHPSLNEKLDQSKGYWVSVKDNCTLSISVKECSKGSNCSAGYYCRESDQTCQSLPQCKIRNENTYGYTNVPNGTACSGTPGKCCSGVCDNDGTSSHFDYHTDCRLGPSCLASGDWGYSAANEGKSCGGAGGTCSAGYCVGEGCTMGSECDSGYYCRQSDHTCQAVPVCQLRVETGYGTTNIANNTQVSGCNGICQACQNGSCGVANAGTDPGNVNCGITGCLTGNCKGGTAACDYYTSGQHNCSECKECNVSGNCAAVDNGTACSGTPGKCCFGICDKDGTTANSDYHSSCRSGPSCLGSGNWGYSAANEDSACGVGGTCSGGYCTGEGCSKGSECNAGYYCRESDHSCQVLPECKVRNETDYGYSNAANGTACSDWGACGSCTYFSTCANGGSGTQSRSICSAGSCSGSESQSCTCSRNTDGTTCRAAAGDCDIAETCSAGSCPVNSYKAAGTECRASTGPCDPAETCPGTSANCPADSYVANNTQVSGCNGICQACQNGSCGVANAGTDPGNVNCDATGCLTGNCKGGVAQCDYYTSGQHNCNICNECNASGNCVPIINGTTCSGTPGKCCSGICDNDGTVSQSDYHQDCKSGPACAAEGEWGYSPANEGEFCGTAGGHCEDGDCVGELPLELSEYYTLAIPQITPEEIFHFNPAKNSGWFYIAQTISESGIAFWAAAIRSLSTNPTDSSAQLLYGITNINTEEHYSGFLNSGSFFENSGEVDLYYQQEDEKLIEFKQKGADLSEFELKVNLPWNGTSLQTTKTLTLSRPVLYESGDGIIPMSEGVDSLYASIVTDQGFWIDFQKFNIGISPLQTTSRFHEANHRWGSFILNEPVGLLPAGTAGVAWEILDENNQRQSGGYTNVDLLIPGYPQITAKQAQIDMGEIEEIELWDSGHKAYLKKWKMSYPGGIELLFETIMPNQESEVLGNYFYEGMIKVRDPQTEEVVGTGMLEQTHDETLDQPPEVTITCPECCSPPETCEKYLGEKVNITVSATDDIGIKQLVLSVGGEVNPNPGSSENPYRTHDCGGATPCSKTWEITLDVAGTNPDLWDWKFHGNALDTTDQSADWAGPVGVTEVKAEVTENKKDLAKYAPKEVFLISDLDWENALPLVPVTTWTDKNGVIYKYPTLIYHQEGNNFDADSILYFLEQYQAQRLTAVNSLPLELTGLINARGLVPEIITQNDYFSYWQEFKDVVYVEADYEKALLASTYASLINAPLAIQGTSADTLNTFQGRTAILVGSVSCPSGAACPEKYTLDQLQRKYREKTNTDKIILVNPNDLNIKVNETFTPEKSGGSISELYSKTSLAAPILAAGKHELILTTKNTQYEWVDSDFTRDFLRLYNFGENDFNIIKECKRGDACTQGFTTVNIPIKESAGDSINYKFDLGEQSPIGAKMILFSSLSVEKSCFEKVEGQRIITINGKDYSSSKVATYNSHPYFEEYYQFSSVIDEEQLLENPIESTKWDVTIRVPGCKIIREASKDFGGLILYEGKFFPMLSTEETNVINKTIGVEGIEPGGEAIFNFSNLNNKLNYRIALVFRGTALVSQSPYNFEDYETAFACEGGGHLGKCEGPYLDNIRTNVIIGKDKAKIGVKADSELPDGVLLLDYVQLIPRLPKDFYLTIMASPDAIQMSAPGPLTVGGKSNLAVDFYYSTLTKFYQPLKIEETDFEHYYAYFPKLLTGRIFGITLSDISSYIVRDLFFDQIEKDKSGSFIVRGTDPNQTPEYLKEQCRIDKYWGEGGSNIYNKFPDGVYSCYSYYDQNVGCDTNREITKNSYYNSYFTFYSDHGSYNWAFVHSSELSNRYLQPKTIITMACSTCDFTFAKDASNSGALFCMQNLRKGVLAYIGAQSVALATPKANVPLVPLLILEKKTLGEAFHIYNHIWPVYFVLIGDPTLRPIFW